MARTGKIQLNIVAALWFLLFFAPQAFAEIKVQSLVDRNELGVGDSFVLEVQISSDEEIPIDPPALPTIAGVELVNRSTHSESRSSVVATGQGIDFKNIKTTVYRFEYLAQKKGKVQIDPIRVNANRKEYRTKAIQLNVMEAGSAVAQNSRSRKGRSRNPADPFSQMEEQFDKLLRRHFGRGDGRNQGGGQRPGSQAGSYATAPKNKNHAFFILAEVDKTEAFKGEQIVASWYLYTLGSVRDIDTLKYPTLKGFWKEDIQISTHLNFQGEVVNGLPYKRALLASYALFPIEEGKAKIDSYKAKATILRGFGRARGQTQTKASDMIPIFVKPLPTEGKPADFTGAVGKYQMKAEVADKTVVENQPFSLKLRFDGRGNAKLIELPSLNLPDDLELYDKSNESQFFKNGQSFKEFTILLIPRKTGTVTVPAFKNSFFDPVAGAYVELSTEPIVLNVLKGADSLSMGDERMETSGGASVEKKLPGLAMSFDPTEKASKFPLWPWWVAFLLMLLGLFVRSAIELGWFAKEPDLRDEIKKRFRVIHAQQAKGDFRSLGIDVTNSVYHVLGELSGLGGANIQMEKLMTKIPPSVRREIESPLQKLMDYFGMLGFGPHKVLKDTKLTGASKKNVDAMESLLKKAVELSRGTESKNDKN